MVCANPGPVTADLDDQEKLRAMMLSDRALAVLNFKRNVQGWRGLVRDHALLAGCAQAKPHYHEVHLYCRGDAAERRRLLALANRFGLWASRFRFTHERRNGKLVPILASEAREELMVGTHFHMPVELAEIMTRELLAVADQMDIDVERIRVERPLGRSPARVSTRVDEGWWEAHLAVDHDDELPAKLPLEGVRDISLKIDFITGAELGQGFVNIEAKHKPAERFAAICESTMRSLAMKGYWKVAASLEEVLIDMPVASAIRNQSMPEPMS